MLNVLEGFDLKAMAPAEADHLLIESMRRAFADRAVFPGDPDYVRVPTAGLISKGYAAQLRKSIDRARATPSVEVGHGNPPGYESAQTTHFTEFALLPDAMEFCPGDLTALSDFQTAVNQVPNAEIALVTGGPAAMPTSATLLRK